MVEVSHPDLNMVICAQIGARDHYAFPRAFQRVGMLGALVTDYWQGNPGSMPGFISPRAGGRWHQELAAVPVTSSNVRSLLRQAALGLRGASTWQRVLATNTGFQEDALQHIDALIHNFTPPRSGDLNQTHHSLLPLGKASAARLPITVFSYSYAARDLFRMAKDRGWNTLLGQIDPGPEEGRLIEELRKRHVKWQCTRVPPPDEYYESWREEVALADRVIVNSEWSAAALRRQGVAAEKLVHIPIPYEPDMTSSLRSAPEGGFGPERPLRVLFLGQVNLRKGICELLEAMRLLHDKPVELTIVGAPQVILPPDLRALPSLRWIGPIPRGEIATHLRRADVFILPTHSDGFGLTQLEALGHRLPVIVSENCARLVQDDVQGRVLPEVSSTAIAAVLNSILADPDCLTRWSKECAVPKSCRIDSVATCLRGVLDSLPTIGTKALAIQ